MKLCPNCQRHLRSPEPCCPFCGAEQRSAASPNGGPGVTATVLLGVMLTACGDRPLDTAGSSDGGASTSMGATMTSGGSSTGSPTTTGSLPGTGSDGSTTPPGPTTDGSSSSNSDPSLDAGDEGCAFYAGCPPDVGPSKLECDPFVQDCPADQKCAPWTDGAVSWNATKCVPIGGDKQPGEACTAEGGGGGGMSGLDDCAKGSMCWEVDDGGQGICVGLCGGNFEDPTCPAGQGCLVFNPDALFICSLQCDPLMQGCPGDDVCVFTDSDFLCVLDASEDMGAANNPCEFNNACDPGLTCQTSTEVSEVCDENVIGCCTPFCEFPDGACPNPDQVCVQFFMDGEGDPGDEDIGLCMIAP
jgi:hypothetical protein